MIDIKTVKNDFDNGIIEGATSIKEPLLSGWILLLHYKNGKNKTLTSQRDKNNSRVFKTADAVLKLSKEIGIYKVNFINK